MTPTRDPRRVGGFYHRNRDALLIELVSAIAFGGVVAGVLLVVEQHREDQRASHAQSRLEQQFDRAQQLTNEQLAREASATLSGLVSYAAVDLRDTTLSGLQMTNCPNGKPELDDICVSFYAAQLQDANLVGANLRGANTGAADFSRALLATADLSYSMGAGTNFHCVVAMGAIFNEASQRNADFTSAFVDFALFVNANLSGSDFSRANVSGANFSGANLENVVLDGTFYRTGSAPLGLSEDVLSQLVTLDSVPETGC